MSASAAAFGGEVAHWRFEEVSGTVAIDVGPGALDGALGPLPTRVASVAVDPVPQSQFTNSRSLDLGWVNTTTGGYVTIPDPVADLSPGAGSFTFEAWVQLDELGSTASVNERQWLVQKKPSPTGADAELDYALLVQTGPGGTTGRELSFRCGDTTSLFIVVSSLVISDLAWHHVSVAYDAAQEQLRFGLDGTFDTVPFTKPSATNAGPVQLRAHQNATGAHNQFLRGRMDEVRYTERFLEPAELLDAPAIDCDASGTSDFAECLQGLFPDCNGNGVPDVCDITSGPSGDCQLDGIPDDCQLEDFRYLWHSDASDGSVSSDGMYTGWLDSHEVREGMGTITHVDVFLSDGFLDAGADMTVYLWSDPDGDRDPTDAQVLASLPVDVTAGMLDRVNRFDVPDTFVGADGTRFFVGVLMETVDESGAAFDILEPGTPGVSWLVGRDTPIDPDDLSAGAVEFAPIENLIPFTGNWVMSAVIPSPEADCNGNGVPDSCDISLVGTSLDHDANGVPDECETAGIFFVPDTFATIQSALDTVLPGSEIVVRPGSYVENIDFRGKAVTLRSEQGPALTVIDGGDAGSVVQFRSGEGPDSLLTGFTLTNGAGNGGGVYCQDSSPTLRANVITGNGTSSGLGGGILLDGACDTVILENEISFNVAQSGGGILMALANSAPTIQGNRISDNTATGDHGGGIVSSNGSPTIVDNEVLGNTTTNSGGGMLMIFSAGFPATVARNLFAGNHADEDGGGVWIATNDPEIHDNVFAGNTSPIGAGLYLRDQTRPPSRNTFVDNVASSAGGGVYLDGGNSTTLSSSILRGNSAPVGSQIALNGDPVTLEYCTVEGGFAGTGNIDLGAQFLDADGPDDDPATFGDNDYRLASSSPCVDAGDPLDSACPGLDLGGSPRLLDGDLNGAWRVDMGAHEFGHVRLSLRRVPRAYALPDSTSPIPGGTTLSPVPRVFGAPPTGPSGWIPLALETSGTPGLTVTFHLSGTPLAGCETDVGATYFDPADVTVFPGGDTPSVLTVLVAPGDVVQAIVTDGTGSNTSNPIFVPE